MAGITIASNIGSLTAGRLLDAASGRLSQAYQRLSSGARINKGSDDAAGLAVSSSLNADVRILNQGIRNLNDGISLAGIGEGSLNALKDISLRQRELATQAANGNYTLAQRQAMNAEANKLVDEYNRIVQSTSFNGTSLFGDGSQGVRLQAGTGTNGSLLMSLGQELSRNSGDGTFQNALSVTVGSYPSSVVVSDFNLDGKADMASANASDGTVSVLIGNGDGSFKTKTTFNTGDYPNSIVTGDFNGDGKADLATADQNDPGTLSIFLGQGDGTFQAKGVLSTGQWPNQIEVGDFNGDRKDDLVAVNADGTVDIFLGNGDGTFQTGKVLTIYASWVAIGDFDADGKADLVGTDQGNGIVNVCLGKGDGTFEAKRPFTVGSAPGGVTVADLNGDGKLDIAAGDLNDNTVNVLLGNGDGTFQTKKVFTVGDQPGFVGVADFNGDGRADLATADWSSSTLSVLIGNGNGTFQSRRSFTVTDPWWGAIADINSDGRADFLAPNYNGSSVSVLLGNGARITTAPYLNLCTAQGALNAMAVIDGNLDRIEQELGSIGAVVSRFSAALGTLQARKDNEAQASSRITDADVANEAAEMVRNQILRQTAASVLEAVNQSPEIALNLLKAAGG